MEVAGGALRRRTDEADTHAFGCAIFCDSRGDAGSRCGRYLRWLVCTPCTATFCPGLLGDLRRDARVASAVETSACAAQRSVSKISASLRPQMSRRTMRASIPTTVAMAWVRRWYSRAERSLRNPASAL